MAGDNSESNETLGVRIVAGENHALASLQGRIDMDSSPAVRRQLLAFFKAPHPPMFSIDLSGVTHIDSSGIATLIEALRIARKSNTDVKLQGLKGRLLRLFEATGILQLFNGSMETNSPTGTKAL